MQVCPECANENREGVLFCEKCGKMLVADQSAETDKLENARRVEQKGLSWGTALFEEGGTIVFHVGDNPKPLVIKPGPRLIIGRPDAATGTIPDVDLMPYGALRKGVSRKHAMIERTHEGLCLIDLGSRNDTFLNGQRLMPLQPRVLRDGDEVRLGALTMRIYFHGSEPNPARGNSGPMIRAQAEAANQQFH